MPEQKKQQVSATTAAGDAPAVPPQGTEPEIRRLSPVERFVSALAGEAQVAVDLGSANEISELVVTAMLEADSLEAAIAAQDSGPDSGKDMVDVELVVTDFTVVKSDGKYKTTVKHYLNIEATRLDNGEQVKFACGAPNVVTLLHRARRDNRLPLECVIRSKETANGELLMLRLLPPRAVRV